MLSLDTKANRHPLPFAFSPIGAIILGKLFFLLLALITRPQSGRECKIESHESNAPRSSSAKSRYVCRRKPRTRWWGSDYVCRWGATRKPIDDDINCGLRGRPTFATTHRPGLYYLLSHKVLEHGTFTRRLTTDHGDLRQVQLHVNAQWRKCILQLVHDRNQLLHAHVGRHRGAEVVLARLPNARVGASALLTGAATRSPQRGASLAKTRKTSKKSLIHALSTYRIY